MNKPILALTALMAAACAVAAQAQAVYRCQLADGSVTFSDLPCQSDIGQEDMVDATPHQGHRPSPNPGEPAYKMPGNSDDGARRGPDGHAGRSEAGAAGDRKRDELTRRERMALERERKTLLSDLKRRHVIEREQRAMIRDLREIDSRLGLGPSDVSDMPLHDRDVYEEHNIYPSQFEVIDYPFGDPRR